jgi:hypothetical protein
MDPRLSTLPSDGKKDNHSIHLSSRENVGSEGDETDTDESPEIVVEREAEIRREEIRIATTWLVRAKTRKNDDGLTDM